MDTEDASARLQREQEFHDRTFAERTRTEAERFYAVTTASEAYYSERLRVYGAGKRVLECGCGPRSHAIGLAHVASHVTAIDLSPVAIEKAAAGAREEGVADRMTFHVMNAEELTFPDDSFDLVCGHSIIHHLDLPVLFDRLRRLLRPGGVAVFEEPLGHNPLINAYRRRTPDLRTVDEHPLLMSDVELAGRFFAQVEPRFFHLFTLAGVPFRDRRWHGRLLSALQRVDRVTFAVVPPARAWAWRTVLVLRGPVEPPAASGS